jgi:hypothetical protein
MHIAWLMSTVGNAAYLGPIVWGEDENISIGSKEQLADEIKSKESLT